MENQPWGQGLEDLWGPRVGKTRHRMHWLASEIDRTPTPRIRLASCPSSDLDKGRFATAICGH
eukprot:188297-Pyramimonas_sp.AAC.1